MYWPTEFLEFPKCLSSSEKGEELICFVLVFLSCTTPRLNESKELICLGKKEGKIISLANSWAYPSKIFLTGCYISTLDFGFR